MHSTEADLEALYAAFNARDVDAVVARLTPDVDWPNAWEGGRLTGRAAVRSYWERQWREITPTVRPVGVVRLPDGRVQVTVAQEVRDSTGALLRSAVVLHVYDFRDGLVARMDVAEAPAR